MQDQATNWLEIKAITSKDSKTVAKALDDEWLCRYPRPNSCIHDQGTEFKGAEFQEMLLSYGIQSRMITVENPQANGVLERVHQTISNMIRTKRMENQPWTEILPSVAFAIRATQHSTLKASPAQLVFGRDMINDTSFTADWVSIYNQRQKRVNEDNIKENKSRVAHEYKVGDMVLVTTSKLQGKLKDPFFGPFRVYAVNDNGTITVEKKGYREKINIRRTKPFFKRK